MKKTLVLVGLLIITMTILAFFITRASDQFYDAEAATGPGVFSIVKCKPGPVHQVDPILQPGGGESAHLHQFFAGKGIQPKGTKTTSDDMLNRGTTCPLTAETAGYWVPVVKDKNGDVVPPQQLNVYYRGQGDLRVFPPDFQAICGNTNSAADAQPPCVETTGAAFGWGCNDREGYATIQQAKPCPKRIIAHVQFKFPKSENFPKLAIHARYPTSAHHISSDIDDGGSGVTLHADFWNTWNQEVLKFLVEHCLEGGLDCKQMDDTKLKELGFNG